MVSNTLDQTIGRLIIGRIAGTKLDAETKSYLQAGLIGGITLFQDNVQDLGQLYQLIQLIKDSAYHQSIIAVDQEGGAVQRFADVLTPLPSAMALAASSDPKSLSSITHISGQQLHLLGVNCVFAPTMDINSNPLNPIIGTRSYGNDPMLVAQKAREVFLAYQQEGILSVGKHFPGHGDTAEDSHTNLAVSYASLKTLQQRELIPYKECLDICPAIMVGHIWLTTLDKNPLPASLSPNIITELLRKQLGFNRLVMTDDLEMQAITKDCTISSAAVQSLVAGADLLVICGSLEHIQETHTAIKQAVAEGLLTTTQLEESVHRINNAFLSIWQKDIRETSNRDPLAALAVNVQENNLTALTTCLSGIAQLRGTVPKPFTGSWILLTPDHPRYQLPLYKYLLARNLPDLKLAEIRYSLNPDINEINQLTAQIKNHNCILLTYRALLHKGQQDLANIILPLSKQNLCVIVDTPYDINCLPNWKNVLATFDPGNLAMEALSIILAGQAKALGNSSI